MEKKNCHATEFRNPHFKSYEESQDSTYGPKYPIHESSQSTQGGFNIGIWIQDKGYPPSQTSTFFKILQNLSALHLKYTGKLSCRWNLGIQNSRVLKRTKI